MEFKPYNPRHLSLDLKRDNLFIDKDNMHANDLMVVIDIKAQIRILKYGKQN